MFKEQYVSTELGVLPFTWELKTFEDFADKSKRWSITGGPFGSNLKTTDYTDFGVQIIQLQNIGDGHFCNDSVVYTSVIKANELLSSNIYPGEIILSKMGDPVARACFIPNYADRFLMASDGIRLVVDEKEFNKNFVFHYINSIFFRNRAVDISTGSTRQRISLPQLKKLKIIKPPLEEQKKIAEALSDCDNWIESIEKLIEKKKLIKQGAMQKLLEPKEDWEEAKLGDLTKIFTKQTGFDYSAYIKPSLVKIKTDETIPFIQNKDFENRRINLQTDYYIPLKIAQNFPNILLDEPSLLISISGSVGNIGLYSNKQIAFIGGAVAILKFKNEKMLNWALYYLKSEKGQSMLFGNVKSGSHQNLILDDLRKIVIKYPLQSEQNKITQQISEMEDEITILNLKLEKAKQIKRGMMQDLLTGKVRLV